MKEPYFTKERLLLFFLGVKSLELPRKDVFLSRLRQPIKVHH